MSDRYYQQIMDSKNINRYELEYAINNPTSSVAKKITGENRITRADMSKELNVLLNTDIRFDKLAKHSLAVILASIKNKTFLKPEIPNGRLKSPYIKECQRVFKEQIDMDTATVSIMKTILEKLQG